MSTSDHGEGAPDVYFVPEYVAAAGIAEHGQPLHVEACDGAWRMPLIVRSLGDGLADAITPTFSGIYAAPHLSPSDSVKAWSRACEDLRGRGIVSLVVRGSAAVPQAQGLPGLRVISGGRPTVVLDLGDESTTWDGMRSSCRTRIRKAEKSGYVGRVRQTEPSDVMPDGDFRQLYEATMLRVEADPVYFFTDDYYTALIEGLGANLLTSEVFNAEGEVVATCLLMRHGPRIHYHLAGSRSTDARFGTNNLMMWLGIRYAIEQGLSQFHLGAGAALGDGVFRFKATFGGRQAPYDVSGAVLDGDEYRKLVVSHAEARRIDVDDLMSSRFFPAYRA